MNSDYEKNLEARIDRALKALPELSAPPTLSARVMAAIGQRSAVPWYRQSWEMWPMPVRIGAMAVLIAMFSGLCLASWQLTRAAGMTAAAQEVGRLFSGVAVLWKAVAVLLNAALVICKHLGTTFIVAGLAAMAFAYASCVGLGTVIYRFVFARH